MQVSRDLRKGFFSNSEQVRSAIRSLLASIHLHHSRYVERVDTCKRVRRDQDDTGISVDFIL